ATPHSHSPPTYAHPNPTESASRFPGTTGYQHAPATPPANQPRNERSQPVAGHGRDSPQHPAPVQDRLPARSTRRQGAGRATGVRQKAKLPATPKTNYRTKTTPIAQYVSSIWRSGHARTANSAGRHSGGSARRSVFARFRRTLAMRYRPAPPATTGVRWT